MKSDPIWEPDGWWRVTASDGSIWAESSDEQECRGLVRPGDKLWSHERRIEERWIEVTI